MVLKLAQFNGLFVYSVQGIYQCLHGKCREVLDYRCERRCKNIACDKNVVVLSGDDIFLGDCDNIVEDGTDRVIWENDRDNTLLANCLSVTQVRLDPSVLQDKLKLGLNTRALVGLKNSSH